MIQPETYPDYNNDNGQILKLLLKSCCFIIAHFSTYILFILQYIIQKNYFMKFEYLG